MHGAYICVTATGDGRDVAAAPIDELVSKHGLHNEFDGAPPPGSSSVAFLRRIDAVAADIPDEGLMSANAVIHIQAWGQTSLSRGLTPGVCDALTRLLGSAATIRVLRGAAGPTRYTGGLLHEFAYAHQRTQQPGDAMPHAFLLPMSKTAEWWAKDWMERHTYFLPGYDVRGHMTHPGHVLSAAPGIPHLMRRTYRHPLEPTPAGEYDFLTYFECAHSGVPVFHEVVAALRDVSRNPEWAFVREGPLWHGRRVPTWAPVSPSWCR
jgi:hypothetical protein